MVLFTSPQRTIFYVLDLIECELPARKMFLGFIKRYTQRAKVTKIWRNDPFTHSTPHSTSGLPGCLFADEITLFLSLQGHPCGQRSCCQHSTSQLALQVNPPQSNSFIITAISSLQTVISYPFVLLYTRKEYFLFLFYAVTLVF